MSEIDKDLITRAEFEGFKSQTNQAFETIHKNRHSDYQFIIERINAESKMTVRLEEALNAFTRSINSIENAIVKMDDKMEKMGDNVSENNYRVGKIDEELQGLKEFVSQQNNIKNEAKKKGEEVKSSKSAWWSSFFVFLGIAVPSFIDKADVILSFFFRRK